MKKLTDKQKKIISDEAFRAGLEIQLAMKNLEKAKRNGFGNEQRSGEEHSDEIQINDIFISLYRIIEKLADISNRYEVKE